LTTLPGLLAKLVYLREIGEGEARWTIDDRGDRITMPLIKSFERTVQHLAANSLTERHWRLKPVVLPRFGEGFFCAPFGTEVRRASQIWPPVEAPRPSGGKPSSPVRVGGLGQLPGPFPLLAFRSQGIEDLRCGRVLISRRWSRALDATCASFVTKLFPAAAASR
jgi:hypothetical protein